MKKTILILLATIAVTIACEKENPDSSINPGGEPQVTGLKTTGTSDPDTYQGLRSKWLIDENLAVQNGRNTVEPDLAAMSVSTWITKMEEAGANILEINLENSTGLVSSKIHDLSTLRNWRDNDPVQYRTACANGEITPHQWRMLLIDFLLEAKATGTSIKFAIHQRIYPGSVGSDKYWVFVNDMSNFINKAIDKNVEDMLLGPRLGENGMYNDMDLLLEFSYNASKDINAQTGNWLKTHNYQTNGGGRFGAKFKNIDDAALRFENNYGKNFFKAMEEETGSFCFGYKHFMDGGINTKMQEAGYNIDSQDDWQTFIKNDLGFSDVRKIIWDNRKDYPKHANIIFYGDTGDSFKKVHDKAYLAL
ncbi:MAG: hypothetical protein MI922_01795, partial [Bacteroidales bacterium]|nr:hypothetical protein [Bacteroidales bacterium]